MHQGSGSAPRRLTNSDLNSSEEDVFLPTVKASGGGLSALRFVLLMWSRLMEEQEEDEEVIPPPFINAIGTYRDLEIWVGVRSATASVREASFENDCRMEVPKGTSVRLRWEHDDGLRLFQVVVRPDLRIEVEWDGDPLNGTDLLETFEADPRFVVRVD